RGSTGTGSGQRGAPETLNLPASCRGPGATLTGMAIPFWAVASLVAFQTTLTIVGAVVERKDMRPAHKRFFQAALVVLAIAGMTVTLNSSWRNAVRIEHLEALAPVESASGELVFKGEGGDNLMAVRDDGLAASNFILRTKKSVAMYHAEKATKDQRFG